MKMPFSKVDTSLMDEGFKVMEIQRIGEDRDTTYIVKGIQ
jgi:hypothetical protein